MGERMLAVGGACEAGEVLVSEIFLKRVNL